MSIFPKNIASYGESIDSLALMITVIVGIGLFIAMVILFYSLIKFRQKPGTKATYLAGETWKQLRWVMIPVFILLGLDFFIDAKTHSAWQEIKEYVPSEGRTVKITAQQFSWVFTYPNKDGAFSDGQLTTMGELHVPVNENIIFLLEAKDVLHSFWVPALRLKQDAVPGRLIRGWFRATETGEYDIGCAQICGTGHTMMHAKLVVQSPEDFAKWVADGGKAGSAQPVAFASPAEHGAALYKEKGCVACHSVDGSRLVGPTYKGLFGKMEKVMTDGKLREVKVDEEYLRKSMLEPATDVVDTYPNVMPPQRQMLTDEEITALIEYVKTLQ